MPEQIGSLREMLNAFRYQTHDPRAGGIHRDGVVPHHQHSAWLRYSLDRAIAFHAQDAVHDGEIRPDRARDIEHGPRDPRPMENVLGPPVATARHNAEHVLE